MGILLIPVVFSWLVLRRGYSTLARVVTFSWLALTALVWLGLLAAAGGASTTTSTSTASTSDATTTAAADAPATGEGVTALGRPIQNGDVAVTVTGIEQRSTVGKQEYGMGHDAADGATLVLVHFSMANTGRTPLNMFERPTLKLIDPTGVEYGSDAGADSSYATEDGVKGNNKSLSDLNPGITTRDTEVFEVSKKAFNAATWHVEVGNKDHVGSMN